MLPALKEQAEPEDGAAGPLVLLPYSGDAVTTQRAGRRVRRYSLPESPQAAAAAGSRRSFMTEQIVLFLAACYKILGEISIARITTF